MSNPFPQDPDLCVMLTGQLHDSLALALGNLLTIEQVQDCDMDLARAMTPYHTEIDYLIKIIRRLRSAIGPDYVEPVAWLLAWIDQWDIITEAEYQQILSDNPPSDTTLQIDTRPKLQS